MAGLLLSSGCVALGRSGLAGLPLALKPHEHELVLQRATSAFVAAAAIDGLAPAMELAANTSSYVGGALGTVLAVSNPPRTYNHTRRLVVPAYALAGTRTRRRRGPRGGGSDDDELFGSGGDDGGWGGDDFWGSGGDGDDGDDESGGSSLSARLQDLVLLWSVFCALAFCQTLHHVSPKPKPAQAPAFAALSYNAIKAQLLQRQPASA